VNNLCVDDIWVEIKRSVCGSYYHVSLHAGPATFDFGALNDEEMDELSKKFRGFSEQLKG